MIISKEFIDIKKKAEDKMLKALLKGKHYAIFVSEERPVSIALPVKVKVMYNESHDGTTITRSVSRIVYTVEVGPEDLFRKDTIIDTMFIFRGSRIGLKVKPLICMDMHRGVYNETTKISVNVWTDDIMK